MATVLKYVSRWRANAAQPSVNQKKKRIQVPALHRGRAGTWKMLKFQVPGGVWSQGSNLKEFTKFQVPGGVHRKAET